MRSGSSNLVLQPFVEGGAPIGVPARQWRTVLGDIAGGPRNAFLVGGAIDRRLRFTLHAGEGGFFEPELQQTRTVSGDGIPFQPRRDLVRLSRLIKPFRNLTKPKSAKLENQIDCE